MVTSRRESDSCVTAMENDVNVTVMVIPKSHSKRKCCDSDLHSNITTIATALVEALSIIFAIPLSATRGKLLVATLSQHHKPLLS